MTSIAPVNLPLSKETALLSAHRDQIDGKSSIHTAVTLVNPFL